MTPRGDKNLLKLGDPVKVPAAPAAAGKRGGGLHECPAAPTADPGYPVTQRGAPPPVTEKAAGETDGSLFDQYKHIFDEKAGGIADRSKDTSAEPGAMGNDFMDEAA